jgi:hypothetical protein
VDQYLFFAGAAIVLAIIRYGTYFYTIYKGETKPHAFSWLLWGVVTGIGTMVQSNLGGGPSVWALGFVASTCLVISVLAFFIGEKNYTKSDWAALIACFLIIIIWHFTKNPMIALVLVMVIDGLTYYPTYRKSFYHPQTEPPISYGLAGSRYFLMLFAVPDPTWETLIYPFFLMAIDWIFAVFIVIRRAQLGYPLHEYAAK